MTVTDSQKWLILIVLVLSVLLVRLLGPMLTPFIFAALFAYLGDPLVDQLEEKNLSRTISVVIVFTVMSVITGLVLLVMIPTISTQIASLIKAFPQYIQWISEVALPWLSLKTGVEFRQFDVKSISDLMQGHWGQAGGFAGNVFGVLGKSGGILLSSVANLVLIPVVTFYLLRDWDKFMSAIHHILPREVESDVVHLAKESDEMLGAFLRGQVLVMVSLATIYSIGLWIVGVKFALLIGLVAGLVSFVPYMGLVVGLLVAGAAVMLQTHDPMQLLYVAMVFGVGQLLEGALLTPFLVGDKIGLHPVAVIFSVMAGGQLFGFTGILIALPVAAVLAVVVRDLHTRYMASHLYDASGDTIIADAGGGSEAESHVSIATKPEVTSEPGEEITNDSVTDSEAAVSQNKHSITASADKTSSLPDDTGDNNQTG